MNISSKCEYGARAVVDLARRAADGPVPATQIAERQGIPEKFLVHILLQLKQAGVVRSVRGAHGGYLLARPAQQITLRDVVTAIEGRSLDPLPVKDETCPELKAAWKRIGRAIDDVLASTTIQEISDRSDDSQMYYI